MLHLIETAQPASREEAERRASTRFPIERPVSYKYARRRGWSEASLGKTLNISSTGILFSSQSPLIPGKRLEVSISWPVQLDGKCSLKLVAVGNVVRNAGNLVTAKIEKYDFHVQSAKKSPFAPGRLPKMPRVEAPRLAV